MPTYETAADGWNALGDPTRRAIFRRVAEAPCAVGEIAREMPISRPAVSQHLRVLKDAGLVTDRAEGTKRIYAVDAAGLTKLRIDLLVRKNLFVSAPPQRCFDAFTKQMGTWWPLASHHVGKVEAKGGGIEDHVGGRVFEIGVDGSECVWGHVIAWDPPARFVFTFELDASFQVDATIKTEIDVRFIAENGGTRVELVHRGLRAYGAKAEEMRTTFDGPGGWTARLEAFKTLASAA